MKNKNNKHRAGGDEFAGATRKHSATTMTDEQKRLAREKSAAVKKEVSGAGVLGHARGRDYTKPGNW